MEAFHCGTGSKSEAPLRSGEKGNPTNRPESLHGILGNSSVLVYGDGQGRPGEIPDGTAAADDQSGDEIPDPPPEIRPGGDQVPDQDPDKTQQETVNETPAEHTPGDDPVAFGIFGRDADDFHHERFPAPLQFRLVFVFDIVFAAVKKFVQIVRFAAGQQ